MKRIIFAVSAVIACNGGDVPAFPEPMPDGGHGGATSVTASSSEASSSAASSSASSGAGGGVPGDGSGSRLRRRVYTSTDGLLAHVGASFYDSSLDIDCYAQKVPVGVTLCMPSAPAYTAFSDASCTIRVAAFLNPCGELTAPKYAVVPEVPSTMCGAPPEPTRWYSVGQKLAAVAAYQKSGTTCSQIANPDLELHTLGQEVAYSSFAPLKLITE